jgi:8-oxo-dGTP pyrophosphatase MutT (NUDIX family)
MVDLARSVVLDRPAVNQLGQPSSEQTNDMPNAKKSGGVRATHAGGVVYRLRDATPELLLVTSRFDRTVWVLPKGHIESGESSEEAAVRETLEEAGVTARIIEFLTTARQVVRGAPQWIDYYLMAMETEGEGEEGRRVAWLAEEAAIRRITYEQSRAVLTQACARLGQITGSLR